MLQELWLHVAHNLASYLSGLVLLTVLYLMRRLKNFYSTGSDLRIDIAILSRLQDRANYCRHDLDCGRVLIYEFHNGGRFLSSRQIFRISCTIEALGIANSIKAEVQDIPISLYMPELGVLFGDKPKTGCEALEISDPRNQCKHRVYRITSSELKEGVYKTLLMTYGVTAEYAIPIYDTEHYVIGFVAAQYLDQKYDIPDFMPENLYKLAHLAYNVQADIVSMRARAGSRTQTGLRTPVKEE